MPSAAMSAFDRKMANISRFAHGTTKGEVLELGVGCEIWSKTRRGPDENPLGGVVVECHPGASGFDTETGEFIDRPASFTCFDRYAGHGHQWHRLEEPEVDMATAIVAHSLGLVVRKLAAELAQHKQARGSRKSGSAILSSHEMDLGRYIGALVKAIGAGMRAPAMTVERRTDDDDTF